MSMGEATIGFLVQMIVEPDEVGFHAYCPSLKGLHTCGDTEEEALRNASDAVIAYIRSLIKHGDPIPVGIQAREDKNLLQSTVDHSTKHVEALRVALAI